MTFGAYLNELLTIKQIDKKHFSAIMGINRSQLYRFLSGEQIPDSQLIEKIASKLYLRTSEHEKLQESYECTLYGSHIIEGRKIVLQILKDFMDKKDPNTYHISFNPNNIFLPIDTGEIGVIPISSKNHITAILFTLLESLKQKSGKIHIKMIIQPDVSGLMELLSSLLDYLSTYNKDVLIEHIIRFKDATLDRNKLYNLYILQKLLPLSKYEKIYKAYYTIGNYQTDVYEGFFPNVICYNTESALSISSDYEKALYFSKETEKSIKMMLEEIDKIQKDSLPLFINLHNLPEMIVYMKEFEKDVNIDTFLIHPENGFYSFPIKIIKKMVKEANLTKEIAGDLAKRIHTFRERLKSNKAVEVTTLIGLENFTETGVFLLQDGVTLTISDRIEILKSLLHLVENEENYSLYIMKEHNHFSLARSAFYIIGEELLYIVPSYTNYDTSDNIILREKGIIQSFKDFFTSYFNKTNTVIDKTEVANILKDKIKFLRDISN